jgi:hypothetical protein
MRWRNEKSEGIARRVYGRLGSWLLRLNRVPLPPSAHAARILSIAAAQEVRIQLPRLNECQRPNEVRVVRGLIGNHGVIGTVRRILSQFRSQRALSLWHYFLLRTHINEDSSLCAHTCLIRTRRTFTQCREPVVVDCNILPPPPLPARIILASFNQMLNGDRRHRPRRH